MALKALSFKVDEDLHERLRRAAAKKNITERYTQSDLVRDILDANLPPLRPEREQE